MKDIITLDQDGKLLSNLHWRNCLDELPPVGKIVLGYVPFNRVYIEHRSVCYDIVWRKMLDESIIKNKCMGNNLREYEWGRLRPGNYFGQQVVAWANIDVPEEMEYPSEFETLRSFYRRTGKYKNLTEKEKEYMEYLESIVDSSYSKR